jgi:ketosteroid isomerase-like protein
MSTQALVALIAMALASPALAQESPEQQIRSLIEKDATNRTNDSMLPDALWWTGATAHPHRMNEVDDVVGRDNITAPGRKNVAFAVTPERITVSGDMAMEYSTFRLAYDDNEGHKSLTGALLRVWQRQNGAWKVAANFQRPYGRVVPVEPARK